MKEFVKKTYSSIAKQKKKSCCSSSCGTSGNRDISEKMGYAKKDLDSIPEDANMGLGCGNPVAIASLKEGETVIDLGSGGGIDVFLAAKRVGEKGKAIGIDMTEEMVKKARENAKKGGFKNVEFKKGDIENIPLQDNIADCIISNCVINLAEDKQKVFNEAYRVLKTSGRLLVSDIVILSNLPNSVIKSAEMYAGCIAGALKRDDYINKIKKAGFRKVDIVKEDPVNILNYIGCDKIISNMTKDISEEEIKRINKAVISIKISAVK